MTDAGSRDDNLEAAVEQALAPYKDLLPAEELQDFREVLREELARHPVSARLLKQLGPPPTVEKSGDLERSDGAAEPTAPGKPGKAESGGQR
jgi:hypothetical protein